MVLEMRERLDPRHGCHTVSEERIDTYKSVIKHDKNMFVNKMSHF